MRNQIETKVKNSFSEGNKRLGIEETIQEHNAGLGGSAIEIAVQYPQISNRAGASTEKWNKTEFQKLEYRKKAFDFLISEIDKSIEDLVNAKNDLQKQFSEWKKTKD